MATPWVVVDETLDWKGEWDTTASYEVDDAVLYRSASDGAWHAFLSKITHNVGNTPTTSPEAWRRLYQEPML